jgi:L-threonylcarbamoyladenylate synthase
MNPLPFRDPADAERALPLVRAHLSAGGVLAYPTETVYGLGTALLPTGLAALAAAKARDAARPFLLLDASPPRLPGLHWTPAALLLARHFWPGPLTLALAADDRYQPPVRSPAGTVAVRDTPLPALRTLLALLAEPITSTSANLPGEPPATDRRGLEQVLATLPGGERVLLLDGGSLPASAPSTVVDCAHEQPRMVRAGAVSLQQLRAALRSEGMDVHGG